MNNILCLHYNPACMIKRLSKDILAPILSQFRHCNVVMFHIGRCGSTVVSDLLGQHPDVHWASELYEPIFGKWRRDNAGIEVVGEMPADAIDILRKNSWLNSILTSQCFATPSFSS